MQEQALLALEKLLNGPRDNALLRFSLGNAYLEKGDAARAVDYFSAALAKDPNYSAAWKLLGKAHSAAGNSSGSLAAYEQGIAVAQARGDVQAAKEMSVFLRRLKP